MGTEDVRMLPNRISAPAFFLVSLLAFSGCEPVTFGTGGPTTTDTTAATGTLTFTNKIEKDGDKLTVKLFAATAQSVDDAPAVRILGDVDTGKTVQFTVPVGTYKIGYVTLAKAQAMPADTLVGGQQEWPAVTFSKNQSHFVTLYTDIGGTEVWQSDFYNK
jgi:hypothetical protein